MISSEPFPQLCSQFVPATTFLQRRPGNTAWRMGSTHLREINDFARLGYELRVECHACHHRALVDPLKILLLCHEHRWSRDIQAIERRMRCSQCQSRHVTCGPADRLARVWMLHRGGLGRIWEINAVHLLRSVWSVKSVICHYHSQVPHVCTLCASSKDTVLCAGDGAQ